MSSSSEQASEQGRFAAREFVARWTRETGETPPPMVSERMLFAYEMGYLRGRSDAADAAMKMFDDVARLREEAKKGSDDDETK